MPSLRKGKTKTTLESSMDISTLEEFDFIINDDIKYRMGNELSCGEEDSND